MKVELKTILCGPDGNGSPGDVVDMPNDKALDMIRLGFAVAVKSEPTKEVKKAAEVETATMEPVETAIGRRGRKPRGN